MWVGGGGVMLILLLCPGNGNNLAFIELDCCDNIVELQVLGL